MLHVAALALAVALPTQTPSDADKLAWLKQNAIKIESIDPDFEKTDDLKPVLKAIGGSRVVMLGEPTHGDGAGFDAKVRLIKFLHKQGGFGVVAWESGMFGTEKMAVGGKPTDDMKVMGRTGVFPLWADTAPVQNLMQYALKSWQAPRPLRMTGFDMQPTGTAAALMPEFIAYVVEGNDDDGKLNAFCKQLLTTYGKYAQGDADAGKSLTEGLDRLSRVLAERPAWMKATRSEEDIELCERYVDDLKVLVKMVDAQKQMNAGLGPAFNNPRDQRMGENLIWLAQKRYAKEKIIGWGATFHFVRKVSEIAYPENKDFYGKTVTMGETAAAGLKGDMYTIAITAYQGKGGIVGRQPFDIPAATKGSFEDLCQQVGSPYLFVDLRGLPKDHWLRKQMMARPLGYGEMTADWSKQVDAFLFISEMTPAK